MIILKTREEIEIMRESALSVSRTLGIIAKEIKPGVTTLYLDKLAEEYIRDNGGTPLFKGMYGFPNTLCMSLNESVVHGIPNDRPLEEGDIISVDCGVLKNGYCGDHAYTFGVGEIKPEVQKLLDVTLECLYIGIEQFKTGNRIGDIGHGLGQKLHEDPEVPNYGKRGDGPKIKDGMVIAIEPMINMGTRNIKQLKDGWTILTADKKPSAHFEHDVALIDGKPEILSTFKFIEEALNNNN